MTQPCHVLFVVTEDWYFVSHRLQLATRLLQRGYKVSLASRFSSHQAAIERSGIACIPLQLRRSGGSLGSEIASILELRRAIRRASPTIVHCVALKPVVYAGLAAFGLPRVVTVNAIAGLGRVFSGAGLRASVRRGLLTVLLRLVLARQRAWVIVQNPDDERTLRAAHVGSSTRTRLIRGAGVELDVYVSAARPTDPPIAILAGRMLRDKGVEAFVRAAVALKATGVVARFQLAGLPDPDNPASVTTAELRAWEADGSVEWLGRRDDMPAVFSAASVVCLPTTYGEGIPKALIEAAACARPIVATAWPGCREIVKDDVNGILVVPHDDAALQSALRTLLTDPVLRERMGASGRSLVESEFSIEAVTAQTAQLYADAAADV